MRPWLQVTGLLLWASVAGPLLADEADEVTKVRDQVASQCVYRIESNDNQNQGSAVVLEVTDKEIYVATCYHVLMEAKSFALIDADGATAFEGQTARCYAVPHHDLVILKIDRGAAKGLLSRVKKGSLTFAVPVPRVANRPLPSGFIAGYPFYNNLYLDVAVVQVDPEHSSEPAAQILNRLEKKPAVSGGADPTRGLRFGYVGLRPTVPGMSGGLVLTDKLEFAGIIFGRIPDTVGLMIPGEFVLGALGEAKRRELPRIAAADLNRHAWPFSDLVKAHLVASDVQSVIEWDEFGHWLNYFHDPAPFREAFQEIELNPELLKGKAGGAEPTLSVRVRDESFDAGEPGKQHVRVWANGRSEPAMNLERGSAVSLTPHLVPGENLVILTKTREASDFRSTVNLNKTLSSNRLEFDIMAGDRRVCRVVRSLPAFMHSYSVYMTLQRPFRIEPYHARLAVRTAWAQDVLGRPVHTWRPAKEPIDRYTGSFIKGYVAFRPQDDAFLRPLRAEWERVGRETWVPAGAVGMRARSPQTLEVVVLAEVRLEELYANYLGAKVRARPKDPVRLLLRGRLQLVRSPVLDEGFFLSLRAVSAYTDTKLDIPLLRLGDVDVQVDMAGVLQEAFLNWVNSQFLHPERPLPLLPAAPQGAAGVLRPAQVFLQGDRMIATFQAYDPKTRRLCPGARGENPATPAPGVDTVVEFEAMRLPTGTLPLGTLLGDLDKPDPIVAEVARIPSPLPVIQMTLRQSREARPGGEYALPEDLNQLAAHFRSLLLKDWEHGEKTVCANLNTSILTNLIATQFNNETVKPSTLTVAGELQLSRKGYETQCTGKKLQCTAAKITIGSVTIENAAIDIESVNLKSNSSNDMTGLIKMKLKKMDLTIPDLGTRRNMRCDRIEFSLKNGGGLDVTFDEAPWDGGRLHKGAIRLDKKGQLIPNN